VRAIERESEQERARGKRERREHDAGFKAEGYIGLLENKYRSKRTFLIMSTK